jgi:F0F1-type ATP synthase assembly protein I
MANNIFDWDDEEEEKKSEAEVWGAYPLAQPPDTPAPAPPEPPAQPIDLPIPPRPSGSDRPEIDTVMRPGPESWQQYPTYQQAPQQDTWVDYPPDSFDQPPPQPGVWSEYKPASADESARQGGLAWSAGIVFFSSVGFMLFLGWIADWLFGSSPWGVIGGIVLGSILGFVQFFRISSRIFGSNKGDLAERPLMPRDDERV